MENSGYSDIFHDSPLRHLRARYYSVGLLDQCMCGGSTYKRAIRKRTHFQSSSTLYHVNVKCQGDHEHLHLRGQRQPSASMRYPREECRRIAEDARNISQASEGGRKDDRYHFPSSYGHISECVQQLYICAQEHGLQDMWQHIMDCLLYTSDAADE